jgi:parallel beta-helix repeat protein
LIKKIKEDKWVICPECKAKLKQQNLSYHMKHVHNKKIDDKEIKPLETSNKKRLVNKNAKISSKKTINIIIILFIVVVALISIYLLSNPEDSNEQNDKKSYFVSIKGKGNYSSIQDAVDSASDNDIIFVSNGIYFENIIINKQIQLIGEDKNTTIINGNGSFDIVDISADYVKISGFTITNGSKKSAGIRIRSNYNTISNCNISLNKNYGLYLDGASEPKNNIINFNTFFNNNYGLFTEIAKTNNISSNTFTHNTLYSLYLTISSNDNLISDNKFTDNNYALRIKGSGLNTIMKNQIKNNKYGLYFCCGAENNIAYNNIFINNINWNAKDDPGNIWDNGMIGNNWDDYTGTDVNGDGIGDTPYIINSLSGYEDRFPLMKSP